MITYLPSHFQGFAVRSGRFPPTLGLLASRQSGSLSRSQKKAFRDGFQTYLVVHNFDIHKASLFNAFFL